jgi:hypothetical protein
MSYTVSPLLRLAITVGKIAHLYSLQRDERMVTYHSERLRKQALLLPNDLLYTPEVVNSDCEGLIRSLDAVGILCTGVLEMDRKDVTLALNLIMESLAAFREHNGLYQ